MFTVIGNFKFNKEAEGESFAKILDVSKFIVNKYSIDFDHPDAPEHLGKITSIEVSKEKWNQTSIYVFASVLHSTSAAMALAMFDAGVRAHGYVTQFDFDEPQVLSMSRAGADIRCLVDPFELGEMMFSAKWNPMWCPFVGPARRLWWSGYRLSLFQNQVDADRQALASRQFAEQETIESLFAYERS